MMGMESAGSGTVHADHRRREKYCLFIITTVERSSISAKKGTEGVSSSIFLGRHIGRESSGILGIHRL